MVTPNNMPADASTIRDRKTTTVGRKRVDHEAKDTSAWMTRHEASDMLSVSAQTLANYARRGRLHPQYAYRRDRHNIERRVVVYDPLELKNLRTYRPHIHNAVAPRDPGEVGARAFELFREGRAREAVVVELRLAPEAVDALYDRWLDMGGADLVISPNVKTALVKMVGPFSGMEELLEKLGRRLEPLPEVRERLDDELAPRA